jgi:hypothetical protein
MNDDDKAPSRDHVHKSRVRGGTLNDPGNRAIVCRACNEDKGARSLASWLYWLRVAGDRRAGLVQSYSQQR